MYSTFRLTVTHQQSVLLDFQPLSQSQKPKAGLKHIYQEVLTDSVVLVMSQSFTQVK